MALASPEDVAKALGRDLTDEETRRVTHLLDLLSDKFRTEARQTFTVETHTHRVKVNGRRARPHRTPLIAVTTVTDDAGAPVPYMMRHGYVEVPLPSDRFVIMTYRAGYPEVPDDVTAQIADSAARILRISPDAAAGRTTTSITTGPFSESAGFATWAVGGQTMLSPDDVALARSYRPRRAGNVWVGAAR